MAQLSVDLPRPGDPEPRSGRIAVKGWALCPQGVDRVEVEVQGIQKGTAKLGFPRHDVRAAFPDLDRTGRSGFSFEFDSTPMANGRYPIFVRLISRGQTLRQVETAVLIDHQRAFSSEYARWIAEVEAPGEERFRSLSAELPPAYVLFRDPLDELSPTAPAWLAETIESAPDADFIYSDEDQIDASGRRHTPFFKPDWSPDLLLSQNYIGHFLVLRRDLLDRVGGYSDEYDLVLRASEQAKRIIHIPKVLYHRRAPSAGSDPGPIEEHCRRTGRNVTVSPGIAAGRWRVRDRVPGEAGVSIIIPSGGRVEPLRENLLSLFTTEYPHYEILIVDNARHTFTRDYVEGLIAEGRPVRLLDWRKKPFNFSAICNAGAREARHPLLLFLNDDTSVISPGWLQAMAELAVRPQVGAVGAKLLYPEGRIQHAGVILGVFGLCGHAFRGADAADRHYHDFPDVIRNVSAVTAACLMTRAEVFRELGGFDEEQIPLAFSDIDLCLRMAERGYRVLFTPYALLNHHEALSKRKDEYQASPAEIERFRAKWGHVIERDPFYSPNLSRIAEDYGPRF